MKRKIIGLLLLCSLFVNAQEQTAVPVVRDTVALKAYFTAMSLLKRSPGATAQKRAFSLLEQSADRGEPRAVNALGILYMKGWGCAVDTARAIALFEQAGAQNYLQGYYNLLLLYRKGDGVAQDFEKVKRYALLMSQSQNPKVAALGNFYMGYSLYKGLGDEHNYTRAIEFFKKASDQNHPMSNYFLGMAYRNGYGVERNEGEANFYLQKGKVLGSFVSKQELSMDRAENPLESILLSHESEALDLNRLPRQSVRTVRRHSLSGELSGTYTGQILTYDYSGMHIIKASPLTLQLQRHGDQIAGRWMEADTVVADLRGVLKDSSLVFTDVCYRRDDRYIRKGIEYEFLSARLDLNQVLNRVYLSGPVRFQAVKYREPGRPMFMSLQRSLSPQEREEMNSLVVYPNPFETEIQLYFRTTVAETVSISITSAQGIPMWSRSLGELPAGEHVYRLPLNLPLGVYVIRINKPSGVERGVVKRQ